MYHLNGNILCAIDTETSGLNERIHDLLQIAIVPLNYELKPHPEIIPFTMKFKPIYPQNATPEAMRVNGMKIEDLILNGVPHSTGSELFEDWFKRLNLPERKKIMPLGHNYASFDRRFIVEWLGEETYNYYFDYHIRDTAAAALYLNDRANFSLEKPPFPKFNLQYIASQLGVVNQHSHDALQDAVTCAECYRRMMGKMEVGLGIMPS